MPKALNGEGLAEGIDLAINFPSLDLQRDEHRDNRGDQCDQSSEQVLPVIDFPWRGPDATTANPGANVTNAARRHPSPHGGRR